MRPPGLARQVGSTPSLRPTNPPPTSLVIQTRLATALVACSLAVPTFAQSSVRPLQRSIVVSDLALALASTPGSAPFAAAAPSAAARMRSRHDYLEKIADTRDPELFFDLKLDGSFRPQSDFDNGHGSARVQRMGWDAEIGTRLSATSSFSVDVRAEATFYDFQGATTLVPGSNRPFNDVYETSIGTQLTSAIGDRTSFFTSVDFMLSGEDSAKFGDAASVGAITGARFQARDDLALSLGIDFRTRLEDDPWVIPFLGLDWKISERWRLQFEGTQGRLGVDLADDWTLFGEARYEMRQYRLNDSNPLPSGVARDEEIDIGTGLEWRPKRGVKLAVSGGLVAWQELSTFDQHGTKIDESELDPGFYGAISLSLAF